MEKSFTKRMLSCRVLLSLCLFAIGLVCQAANITVDGINYTTNNKGEATVAKYTIIKYPPADSIPNDSLFYTGDIVIPQVITYDGKDYTVVATATNCFAECKDLTSVTLPSTCVTIGRNCFKNCSKLTKSPIPETATSVGNGVFSGCTSLEEITIVPGWTKPISEEFANCPNLKRLIIAEGPDSVVMKVSAFGLSSETRTAINSIEYIYMGRNVEASNFANNEQPFHSMGALKTLVIGGETTTIQNTTFQGCTALQEVTFEAGNKITNIGVSAFTSCTSLPSIDIPAGVTVIEQGVFNGCRNLRSVTLGDAVTSIAGIAFYNTGLTFITFPSSLTSIGQSAFENSKLQGDLILPNALTSIGAQAFAGTQLSGVVIPANVSYIGTAAFAPIATLAHLDIAEGNSNFLIDNGVLLNAGGTRLLVSAQEGNIGTSYSNATVTSIDNYGLAYAPFVSVDFPALTTIGNYGFAYSDLERYTLESNVTIGQNVFTGSALKEIVIGEGRNEIPQGLCSQCVNLSKVTLPSTVTNMMRNCFEGCTALEEMEIPANVNYMESGSVPATIKTLRVLNVSVPVLAAGVFDESQSDVLCKVAETAVSSYKDAAQWQYLNIVGDPTISGTASQLGCPTGLYFATKDGKLMYLNDEGNVIDTEFSTGAHAFNLARYKDRIYVGVAGKNFRYQDAAAQANGGDGEVFYVNNTNGIFYRVTVLNNVGYKAFEDPFSLSILEDENKIVIADRNVGVHEMDADAVGLYGSQPFLVQNNSLKYYQNQTAGTTYGGIGCGFYKVNDVYWMGKKFNGYGIFRFRKSDIAVDDQGNPTAATVGNDPFKIILPFVQMTQYYVDQANGQIYFYMQKNQNSEGPMTPGVYRLPMSAVEAHDAAGEDTPIMDAVLIDDSPVLKEGDGDECVGITQFISDGEYVYWGYIASPKDENSMPNSVAVDLENPLHHSGIKCIAAKPNEDGTMPTTVSFIVKDVEVYGLCGAVDIKPSEPSVITLSDSIVEVKVKESVQLEAIVTPESLEDKTIEWSSSDETIATVDETGLISGVAIGQAVITATLKADPTVTATCLVNVMKSGLKGDVNGDGNVNISDINAVIDMILSGKYSVDGDVNGDGVINIGDINALIAIILS